MYVGVYVVCCVGGLNLPFLVVGSPVNQNQNKNDTEHRHSNFEDHTHKSNIERRKSIRKVNDSSHFESCLSVQLENVTIRKS